MEPDLERWQDELRRLRAVALRLAGDPEVADDLAQEAALLSLRRGREPVPEERGWRIGVLRQLFKNHLRGSYRRRRREASAAPVSERASQPTPSELLEQFEIHRAITEAIHSLDEPHRRALVLRYFHDRSSAEIARDAGEPEATVRSRLARALERLRAELDRKFGGDRRKWLAPLVAWLALSRAEAAGAAAAGASAATPGLGSVELVRTEVLIEGGLVVGAKKIIAAAAAVAIVGAGLLWLRAPDGGPAPEVTARATPEDPESPAEPVAADPPDVPAPQLPLAESVRTIRGRVLDRHTRAPLAGAAVEIAPDGCAGPSHSTETDAAGEFVLPVPDEWSAGGRLVASAERHVPQVIEPAREPRYWPGRLPDILLVEGNTVAGIVVDAAGDPVARARISIWTGVTEEEGPGRPRRRNAVDLLAIGATGADGRFRSAIPAGTSIIAAIAGAAAGTAEVSLPPAPPKEVRVVISEETAIAGRVVDEAGSGIAGARVRGLSDGRGEPGEVPHFPPPPLETSTGADGSFRIPSFGTSLGFYVTHPDFVPLYGVGPDRLRSGIQSTLVLRRARTLRGRLIPPAGTGELPREVTLSTYVTLDASGKLVHLFPGDRREFSEPMTLGDSRRLDLKDGVGRLGKSRRLVMNDGVGRLVPLLHESSGPTATGRIEGRELVIRGVTPDAHRGVLHIEGFRDLELFWAAGEVGEVELGDLPLERGLSLAVDVLGPGGQPIADAGVEVLEGIPRAVARASRTDAAGGATIEGLSGAAIELHVWADGYLPRRETVAAATADRRLEVRLGRPAALVGAVVDGAGRAIEGAFISASELRSDGGNEDLTPDLGGSHQATDVTDAAGRFLLSPLPAGERILLWIQPRDSIPGDHEVEQLAEGESRDLGELALPGLRELTVFVADAGGRPLPGALVELYLTDDDSYHHRTRERADEGGAVRFRRLADGRYTLRCGLPGLVTSTEEVGIDGTDREHRVTLVEGGTWEVTVRDAAGAPVAGARVGAGDELMRPAAVAITDAEGWARVAGIPPGARHYSVEAVDHPTITGEVESPERLPQRISLPQAATVRVHLIPPAGGPSIRKGRIHIHQDRMSWGFVFDRELPVHVKRGCAPGRATIEVVAEGFVPYRDEVQLRAGEETVVIFRPDGPALRFAVRVVAPDGTPIAAARVRACTHTDREKRFLATLTELAHQGDGIYGAELATAGSRFDLLVEAPGFAPTEWVEVAPAEPPVELTLAPECGIDLTVFDADGFPVAERVVAIELVDIRTLVALVAHRARIVTDAHGKASLRGLPAAFFRYSVEDGLSGNLTLAPGEIRAETIRLPAFAEVSGTVLENGIPVAGGTLRASAGDAARTLAVDDRGRFAGSIPAADRVDFYYSHPGRGDLRIQFLAVPVARAEEIRLDYPAARSEIRFVDEAGAPAGPVDLRIAGDTVDGIRGSAKIRAEKDGVAVVDRLPPGRARLSGALPDGLALVDESVVLAPGSSATVRVHGASQVFARIPDGLRRTSLYRIDEEGEWHEARHASKNADPTLAWWWFPSSVASRTAVIDGLGRAPLIVTLADPVPAEPFVLPESAGGRIRFAGSGERGSGPFTLVFEALDAASLPVELSRRTWRGEAAEHPLPTGRYRVILSAAEVEIAAEEVEVRAGEFVELPW